MAYKLANNGAASSGGSDSDTSSVLVAAATSGGRGDAVLPQLADAAAQVFGSDVMLGSDGTDTIRALAAILNNELPARWDGVSPVLGDVGIASGPSVGPGQVLRVTAKSLGLWVAPDGASSADEVAAYSAIANDVPTCMTWMCKVFKSKLAAATGIPDAIRRYNGSGAAATAYQAKALAFIAATWPTTPNAAELPLPDDSGAIS